jgi:hypothetical protein
MTREEFDEFAGDVECSGDDAFNIHALNDIRTGVDILFNENERLNRINNRRLEMIQKYEQKRADNAGISGNLTPFLAAQLWALKACEEQEIVK